MPESWNDALARAARSRCTVVLGPPDVGKSSFIRALASLRPGLALIDLDPGQKMVGPPGSASLGRFDPELRLCRFIFLGSTAVGSFGQIAESAAELRASAGDAPVVVNTSGYVSGHGARLQVMTLAALRPDLTVAIGLGGPLAAALGSPPDLVRLDPSPRARRKTPGLRRRVRQAAFEASLAGAEELVLDSSASSFLPGPPIPFDNQDRPVCALVGDDDDDMEIGLLRSADAETVRLLARRTRHPVAVIRLGKIWAQPCGEGFRLLDRLVPAWIEARDA